MIDKKTVFVLGAGASCPYGYPSGAHLREWICLSEGFNKSYSEYLSKTGKTGVNTSHLNDFVRIFRKSSRQSIDLFIATNSKHAPTGKYIIAFAIFEAERRSKFREEAQIVKEWYSRSRSEYSTQDFVEKGYFQGDDWYSYLFNRLTAGLAKPDILPDFSDDRIAFITFNYDRSLEYFLYDSLSNTFTEVPELEIFNCLEQLKILHVYGQVAPLKWQDSEQGVDYQLKIDEELLQNSATNIKTIYDIYEQRDSPELDEARKLLAQAERIFFLGFGYAPENMEVLGLPVAILPGCKVYGTAFGLINEEIIRIQTAIHNPRKTQGDFKARTIIEAGDVDCLMLLRKHLD